MPTRCWVSATALGAALLVAACAPAGEAAGRAGASVAPDRVASSSSSASTATLTVRTDAGATVSIPVTLDASLVGPAGERELKQLGQRGRFLLVLDGYASRPAGMRRC